MSATIIDGKSLALQLKNNLKHCIASKDLVNKINLAVILVGDDPASTIYVKNKTAACEYVGVKTTEYNLPETITLEELVATIEKLNNDPDTHGILLQLPLPDSLNQNTSQGISNYILEKINPKKDVDGFHPFNLGRLAMRFPTIRPCTPKGIMHALKHYKIDAKSKKVTIIGASNVVGRPLALEMLIAGATVTICHRFTKDLKHHCLDADIICSAVGRPNLILAEYIKPGAIVIDIGITRLANGKLAGDVEYDKAVEKASYITPVPGGIGPMTVAMLLENTVQCYEMLTGEKVIN